MSKEPHPRTEDPSPGSIPGKGPEEQPVMATAGGEDRGGVPSQGPIPDDLAEAGEEQLKEGMAPGGRGGSPDEDA